MEVQQAIATLDEVAANAQGGLPEPLFLFVSRLTPLVNVDLLIQDAQKRTLLTWRDDEFFGRGWHLPGGVIRYKERAADRVQKCAEEELGVQVEFESSPALIVETAEERRTRGHFISLLYRCRLKSELDEERRAGEHPKVGEWSWLRGCPENLIQVQRVYEHYF
jgi:ADP-ribose pyrophosphatase YjhB (NUDIX family)